MSFTFTRSSHWFEFCYFFSLQFKWTGRKSWYLWSLIVCSLSRFSWYIMFTYIFISDHRFAADSVSSRSSTTAIRLQEKNSISSMINEKICWENRSVSFWRFFVRCHTPLNFPFRWSRHISQERSQDEIENKFRQLI